MTHAFSKFCVGVITPNQKAKMVAKALIDKCFILTEFQPVFIAISVGALTTT